MTLDISAKLSVLFQIVQQTDVR